MPATAGAAALRGTKGLIKAIYTALSRHKGSTRVHQAASLAIIRLLRTDTPPPPSRHHRSRSRGRRRSSGGADAPPSATPVVRLADEDREGLLEVLRRAVPRFKHHPHVQTVLTTALKVVLQLPGSKILDGTSRTAPPTVAAAAAAATSVVPGRGHGAAGDNPPIPGGGNGDGGDAAGDAAGAGAIAQAAGSSAELWPAGVIPGGDVSSRFLGPIFKLLSGGGGGDGGGGGGAAAAAAAARAGNPGESVPGLACPPRRLGPGVDLAHWQVVPARGDIWSPRYGHATVVLPSGSVLVMGGTDAAGRRLNDVWRSDDGGVSWVCAPPTPPRWAPRHSHSAVVLITGEVVVMGGIATAGRVNDVWRSADQGETWAAVRTVGTMWSARSSHVAVVLPRGDVLVMGGNAAFGGTNEVWRSVDGCVSWTKVRHRSRGKRGASMWSPRWYHAGVVLPNGYVVVLGGSAEEDKNDVWVSKDGGCHWSQVRVTGPMWDPRWYHTAVVAGDGSMVVMGGSTGTNANDVWRSADGGKTWAQVEPAAGMWAGRTAHCAVTLPSGKVLVLGGKYMGGPCMNDVWMAPPLSV